MSLIGMIQGRRMWILIGNLVSVVGSVISACSYSPGQLIGGRIIVVSLIANWYAAHTELLIQLSRALAMDS